MTNDIRHAGRQFLKAAGFSGVAILTLALCIGADTALFSAIHAVLLRPLPFHRANELYVVSSTFHDVRREFTSYTDFRDWRARSRSFFGMAAVRGSRASMTTPTGPESLIGAAVSEDFFPVFQVQPPLGRIFLDEEYQRGRGRVVILADRLWRRRFGANPGVVGTSVILDGTPNTILGIMPPGFAFPEDAEFWTPLTLTASDADRRADLVRVVARLRHGVTPAHADVELSAIARDLAQRYPATNAGWGVMVTALHTKSTEDVRRTLLALWAAVTCVLLIGCANTGLLLLSRGIRRGHEFAVRATLGAGRWRIARQLFTETVTLSLAGGTVGLLFAAWGIAALRAFSPVHARLHDVALDVPVLLYTVVLSIGTGLVIGVVPVWRVVRSDLQTALKEGPSATPGPRQHRLMQAVAAGQVVVSVPLLVGAGLTVRTLDRLQDVPLGFNADHLLTFYASLPESRYRDSGQVRAFFDELLARVRILPGVRSASAINALYIHWGRAIIMPALVEDGPTPGSSQPPDTHVRIVDPDIHRTLQIPVLSGRTFGAQDGPDALQVAVINQAMAKRYFANQDPCGRRIAVERIAVGAPKWRQIVGVVGDVRQQGLDSDPFPEIHLPYTQSPISTMALLVRTAGDPVALTPAVRAQVHVLDPNLPLTLVQTMDEVLDASMARRRFGMRLLTMFASVALLMTCLGLHGVVGAGVSDRTREIAVRLALGASALQVLRLVVGQMMLAALVAVAVGLLVARTASRYLEPLLFGVTRTDVATYGTTAAILLVAAFVSSYVPARRVTRIDPAVLLRAE